MRIYTKVGDGGNTRLFGGKAVRKDDPLVEALGDVDELNAVLGLARSAPVEELQADLFVLGADLAAPRGMKTSKPVPRIAPAHAARLEREIDALQASLPPLKTFVLPGGAPEGAALHLARAVCRRAERRVTALLKKKRASPEAQIYLNRLSDYLFLLALDANRRAGRSETPWAP